MKMHEDIALNVSSVKRVKYFTRLDTENSVHPTRKSEAQMPTHA